MKESTLEGMVYEVRYFILPKHISPNESSHVVNQTVLDHLIHSGIMPAHSKEEVFLTRGERRTLDASLDEDLYQLLTRTELFRSLSAKEFKEVFPKMRKRNLAEGEELYHQDKEGQSMFVCLEGLLTSSVAMSNNFNPVRVPCQRVTARPSPRPSAVRTSASSKPDGLQADTAWV